MSFARPSQKLYSESPKEKVLNFETLEDSDENEGFLSTAQRGAISKSWPSVVPSLPVFTACLFAVVILQSFLLISNHKRPSLFTPNGLSREYSVERTTYLPSVYWSDNETKANEAWEYISSGFGIVAVKAEYAKDLGLPDSEVWREDSSKRVYVLEAYHAIHCLRRLRSHYLALFHGNNWGWPMEHDMHCLDGLREYVMCNPDDTLLWTTGHGDVGHGQNKKCQDWDALREWAGQRTIAYFDYERGFEEETKGVYHDGDGLPVGSF